MGSSKESILKTLLYSDIFNYPLSKEEIWKFLISKNKEDKQIFLRCLSLKNSPFDHKKNLYFIKGREGIIKKRQKLALILQSILNKVIFKIRQIKRGNKIVRSYRRTAL